MKAIVTGAAGFIGSHLCNKLMKLGHEVIGIDDLSSGTLKNLVLPMSYNKFRFVLSNFSEIEFCRNICNNVDVIFHLAAFSSVPGSIDDPYKTHRVNVTETINLLNAAAENKVDKFVFSSSASVYGNSEDLIKVEDSKIHLLSPYAASKYSVEINCQMFYNLFGLKTISLRYFNVYGSRQNPNSEYAAVVPKFIQCFKENKNPIIFGDGTQTRNFVHVSDVVDANIKSIELNSNFGEAFNIAAEESISINDLIKKLQVLYGKEIKPVYISEREGDIKYSFASIEKAKCFLGYAPITSLDDGLKETME